MEKVGKALITLVVLIAVSAILGYLVMLLWNWVAVLLFGVSEISWLQGWGLMILCNLLFNAKGK